MNPIMSDIKKNISKHWKKIKNKKVKYYKDYFSRNFRLWLPNCIIIFGLLISLGDYTSKKELFGINILLVYLFVSLAISYLISYFLHYNFFICTDKTFGKRYLCKILHQSLNAESQNSQLFYDDGINNIYIRDYNNPPQQVATLSKGNDYELSCQGNYQDYIDKCSFFTNDVKKSIQMILPNMDPYEQKELIPDIEEDIDRIRKKWLGFFNKKKKVILLNVKKKYEFEKKIANDIYEKNNGSTDSFKLDKYIKAHTKGFKKIDLYWKEFEDEVDEYIAMDSNAALKWKPDESNNVDISSPTELKGIISLDLRRNKYEFRIDKFSEKPTSTFFKNIFENTNSTFRNELEYLITNNNCNLTEDDKINILDDIMNKLKEYYSNW